MENYDFLADLLYTFRASPNVIKALWITMPPAFLLGVLALWLRYRLKNRKEATRGDLARNDAWYVSLASHESARDVEPQSPRRVAKTVDEYMAPYRDLLALRHRRENEE